MAVVGEMTATFMREIIVFIFSYRSYIYKVLIYWLYNYMYYNTAKTARIHNLSVLYLCRSAIHSCTRVIIQNNSF